MGMQYGGLWIFTYATKFSWFDIWFESLFNLLYYNLRLRLIDKITEPLNHIELYGKLDYVQLAPRCSAGTLHHASHICSWQWGVLTRNRWFVVKYIIG